MSSNAGEVITQLTENDVVFGRGGPSIGKSGRSQFREIIAGRREEYLNTVKRKDKDLIARQVKHAVTSREGRFLRRVESLVEAEQLGVTSGEEAFVVLDDDTILRRIKESLRGRDSGAPTTRTSSVDGSRGTNTTPQDLTEERPQKKPRKPMQSAPELSYSVGAKRQASPGPPAEDIKDPTLSSTLGGSSSLSSATGRMEAQPIPAQSATGNILEAALEEIESRRRAAALPPAPALSALEVNPSTVAHSPTDSARTIQDFLSTTRTQGQVPLHQYTTNTGLRMTLPDPGQRNIMPTSFDSALRASESMFPHLASFQENHYSREPMVLPSPEPNVAVNGSDLRSSLLLSMLAPRGGLTREPANPSAALLHALQQQQSASGTTPILGASNRSQRLLPDLEQLRRRRLELSSSQSNEAPSNTAPIAHPHSQALQEERFLPARFKRTVNEEHEIGQGGRNPQRGLVLMSEESDMTAGERVLLMPLLLVQPQLRDSSTSTSNEGTFVSLSQSEVLSLAVLCSFGLPRWDPDMLMRGEAFAPPSSLSQNDTTSNNKASARSWYDFSLLLQQAAKDWSYCVPTLQRQQGARGGNMGFLQGGDGGPAHHPLAINSADSTTHPKILAIKTLSLFQKLLSFSLEDKDNKETVDDDPTISWTKKEIRRWAETLRVAELIVPSSTEKERDPPASSPYYTASDYCKGHPNRRKPTAVDPVCRLSKLDCQVVVEQVSCLSHLVSMVSMANELKITDTITTAATAVLDAAVGLSSSSLSTQNQKHCLPQWWSTKSAQYDSILVNLLVYHGYSGVLKAPLSRALKNKQPQEWQQTQDVMLKTFGELGLTQSAAQLRAQQLTRVLAVSQEKRIIEQATEQARNKLEEAYRIEAEAEG